MKKKYFSFYILFLLMGIVPLMGQKSTVASSARKRTPGGKVKWMKNPFDHQVFIENGGQFTGPPNSDKILYGAQLGDVYVYITTRGLIYKYTEYPVVEKPGGKEIDQDDIDLKKLKPTEHYLTAIWEGSTGAANVVAGEEQTNYYTYPGSDDKSTIEVNIFKTITCRNIYPGIDVKYSFIQGKEGFKYALIVHPGADISQIKLKYSGTKKIFLDKDGNVQISSSWGSFTDHAPKSYYDGGSDTIISNYQLQDNTESFHVTNPDANKTLVIDPWVTNWSSTYSGNGVHNGACDLDYDNAGNIYVYGSYNPYQLAKYSSAGVQIWTYNTSNFIYTYYGDFCVDKSTGASFIIDGLEIPNAYVDKVNVSVNCCTHPKFMVSV